MARASRLKLFRTPMGFFDAVVAAPSQAAALKAWGVTSNLFAEKLAEEVKDDPDLLSEASKTPGEVLRKPRGDAAALLATPAPKPRTKAVAAKEASPSSHSRPAERPPPAKAKTPAPDRAELDAAESALGRAKQNLADELVAIDDERAALDAQEAATRRHGQDAIRKAQRAFEKERRAFEKNG